MQMEHSDVGDVRKVVLVGRLDTAGVDTRRDTVLARPSCPPKKIPSSILRRLRFWHRWAFAC